MLGRWRNSSTSTQPSVCITTIVRGFTAATAWMSLSWLPGRRRVRRSASSVAVFSSVPTNTTATSASRAVWSVASSIGASCGALYTR